jgi:hypothetical protein
VVLSKLKILIEIECAFDLIYLNSISNAKKVSLENCFLVKDVRCLKSIPELTILGCDRVNISSDNFSKGCHDVFEILINFKSRNLRTINIFDKLLNIRKYVSIHAYFVAEQMSEESLVFSNAVCSAATVILVNYEDRQLALPVVPAIFPFVNLLKLTRFDLSLWKNLIHFSVRRLELIGCIISDLSIFPEIEYLNLISI